MPEIDNDLDQYSWSLLRSCSDRIRLDEAANSLNHALMQASHHLEVAINKDKNANLKVDELVEDAIDACIQPVFEKYADVGANDTEPHVVAKHRLRDFAYDLIGE